MGHLPGAEKLSASGVAFAGDLAFWVPAVGVCLVVESVVPLSVKEIAPHI
jgi:hypothetical protein